MKALRFTVLLALAIALLFPLYMMVVHSFTPARLILKFPPELWPAHFTTINYERILALPYFLRWVANLSGIAVVTVALAILTNTSAGYAFAYGRFRGKDLLFWLMMAPMFVTRFVVIISQFVVFGKLGIQGLVSVVIVQVFNPMMIFLARNYFQALPASMMESARMDGANEWTVLLRIMLPISKPLIGATVAFVGLAIMGDFVWQMLNLTSEAGKTLIVGLLQSTTRAGMGKDLAYSLAVGCTLMVPYVIIFASSSRYFIEGLKIGVEVEK